MKRLWFSITLCTLWATEAAYAEISLNWRTIGPLFRERFEARSPDRFASALAEENYDLAGRFRFDPQLALSRERGLIGDDLDRETTSASLSQTLPFGLEVSASRNMIEREQVEDADVGVGNTLNFRVEQNLLAGGPLYGWHANRMASSQWEREKLAAAIKFREQFLRALQGYVESASATQTLAAARNALERAQSQNAAVKSLVESGFKAKADILVSEAAEIRADLALQQAELAHAKALRDLERAVFQRPDDEPLSIERDDFPEELIAKMRDMPWPQALPEEVVADKVLNEAELSRDLAWRDDLPQLAIGMSLSRDLDNERDAPTRTYTATLSMPLTSVITRDRAHKAALQYASAQDQRAFLKEETADTRLSIDERIRTAESALSAATRLLDLTKQTLAIEQQKYADGKTTVDQLRRTQDDVDQAEIRQIARRTELLLALLEKAQKSGYLEEVIP